MQTLSEQTTTYIKIFVEPCPIERSLDISKPFELIIESPNVIGNVRYMIAHHPNRPRGNFKLSYNGNELHDGDSFADHNIRDFSAIQVCACTKKMKTAEAVFSEKRKRGVIVWG